MIGSNMIGFVTALVLGMGLLAQGAKPKLQAYFTKVESVNQWPEVFEISYHINRTATNLTSLDVRFKFEEDMSDLSGLIILKLQHGKDLHVRTKLNMDLCTAFQMAHQDYLVQMVFVGLRRVSNIPLSCPFKKHTEYYINGFVVDTKAIPSYMPEVAYVLDLTFFYKARQFLKFKIFGYVERPSRNS